MAICRLVSIVISDDTTGKIMNWVSSIFFEKLRLFTILMNLSKSSLSQFYKLMNMYKYIINCVGKPHNCKHLYCEYNLYLFCPILGTPSVGSSRLCRQRCRRAAFAGSIGFIGKMHRKNGVQYWIVCHYYRDIKLYFLPSFTAWETNYFLFKKECIEYFLTRILSERNWHARCFGIFKMESLEVMDLIWHWYKFYYSSF